MCHKLPSANSAFSNATNFMQLQAKFIPNMTKNSAVQYEVVGVDDADGVQGSMVAVALAAAFDGVED